MDEGEQVGEASSRGPENHVGHQQEDQHQDCLCGREGSSQDNRIQRLEKQVDWLVEFLTGQRAVSKQQLKKELECLKS